MATKRTPQSPAKAKADPKAETPESLHRLKNRLRNEAERDVLNSHRDEVIALTEAKYKEHGLEYVRRLTDEEKAARDIEEHFAKYPGLRLKFAPAETVQQVARAEGYQGYQDHPLVEEPDNYRDIDHGEGD